MELRGPRPERTECEQRDAVQAEVPLAPARLTLTGGALIVAIGDRLRLGRAAGQMDHGSFNRVSACVAVMFRRTLWWILVRELLSSMPGKNKRVAFRLTGYATTGHDVCQRSWVVPSAESMACLSPNLWYNGSEVRAPQATDTCYSRHAHLVADRGRGGRWLGSAVTHHG